MLEYPYVTNCYQLISQTHCTAQREELGKNQIFDNFQESLINVKGQFQGFQGGTGLGHMGIAPTTWGPMDARVPTLLPNGDPNPSQSPQKRFGKSKIVENFQVPLGAQKTHCPYKQGSKIEKFDKSSEFEAK